MKANNKTALVTGGARRLGKDISLELASLGFDVIINYNKTKSSFLKETISEIKSFGVNVAAVKCDVSKVNEIRKMFVKVKAQFGKLDLLVNNAAIFEHTDFLKTDEKLFEKFINTNLKSVFFCTQEAAKIMLAGREEVCRIINIASLGAIENWTGFIPYSISKAAVIKLTAQTAKRLAPKILVNGIAPGTILVDNDKNANVKMEEVKKYPVKKFGTSKDITSLVKYLATENKFITGQTFIVDGGRSL